MVFSCFFFDTNLLFNVYIGSIYILQGRGGLRWAVVTKTGHRFSFFFFFHTNLLFNVYIGSIDVLKGPGGLHWVAVTKTGPNDASGVVWAICNNVWFFVFFFDTNLLFDVYIGSIYILQGRGGLCWAAVTKTGHRFSFFFFFHTNLLFNGYIGSIDVLKGPGGLRWVVVTKTGPNDASGVVWAICNNVWFFLVFFLILTYFLTSI